MLSIQLTCIFTKKLQGPKSNKAEGRSPREAFALQEGVIPLKPHLGFTFANSDNFHLVSGMKGAYQKGRFKGKGNGIMSVNPPHFKD